MAWSGCGSMLREGDVLAVWRLDRLGRTLKHLIELMGELEGQGIGFQSTTEAIDTTTPGGKLVFHIFAALAEFERNLIRERTKAGLEAARARGRKGGRKRKCSDKKRVLAMELYRGKKHTVAEICHLVGVMSRTALYKAIRRERAGKRPGRPLASLRTRSPPDRAGKPRAAMPPDRSCGRIEYSCARDRRRSWYAMITRPGRVGRGITYPEERR